MLNKFIFLIIYSHITYNIIEVNASDVIESPHSEEYIKKISSHGTKLQNGKINENIDLTVSSWEELEKIPNKENISSIFIKIDCKDTSKIPSLKSFRALEKLRFGSLMHVTDDVISQIDESVLKNLKEFYAPLNMLSYESMIRLRNTAKNLLILDVSDNPITNRGIFPISSISKLQKLFISNSQITDLSLENLKKLTNLKELNVIGTSLSKQSIQDLKSAIPALNQPKALKTNKVLF